MSRPELESEMPFDFGSPHRPEPDKPVRPDFLIDGWMGFLGRLLFVVAFLGLLTLVFLTATGLIPG
ncbi:hypothetical protein [Henriciella sp.]|uniref:hypothetical protein n=1 Tax=Henriciella sp. TaxID=1968823 RepID=UPI0026230ABE|nr:hypothetical protein [Henriciella sp.]